MCAGEVGGGVGSRDNPDSGGGDTISVEGKEEEEAEEEGFGGAYTGVVGFSGWSGGSPCDIMRRWWMAGPPPPLMAPYVS